MCDKIIQRNINDLPEFVYKQVVVNKQGKMASCVMLAPIPKTKWVKAKKTVSNLAHYRGFINELQSISPFFKKASKVRSSPYAEDNSGYFACFKNKNTAISSSMRNNAKEAVRKVAKFKVRGKCHETKVNGWKQGYLVKELKFVEFVD